MNRFSTFEDIHKAAVEGDVALVSQKLKQGTSPNIKAVDNGWTPLHYAANYNQTRVAAILLKAGADPDAPSDSGWTPLHTTHDSQDMARTLLKAGAVPDIPNRDGNTPLHLHAVQNNTNIVQMLLKAGADPRTRNNHGLTPAEAAANHPELADILRQAEREYAVDDTETPKPVTDEHANSVWPAGSLFGG